MNVVTCCRVAFCLVLLACVASAVLFAGEFGSRQAVANRESGTVSLVDTADQAEIQLELGVDTEPMYVFSPLGTNELWIGDRANDRVLVFGTGRWRAQTEIPTSSGVFHMWGNRELGQLWVVCDVDKELTVIDLESRAVLATVPIPADLEPDFKPHDVTVTAGGALVTLLGETDPETGFLIAYDGATFAEVARLEVGGDPHLFHWGLEDPAVYAATQRDGKVLRLDPMTMQVTGELDVTGAHGIAANLAESRLYVTNIESEDSVGALVTIDLDSFTILAMSDSAAAFPHNVSLAPDGSRLFITHSVAGVTVYDLDESGVPMPGLIEEAGAVPFGVGVVLDARRAFSRLQPSS